MYKTESIYYILIRQLLLQNKIKSNKYNLKGERKMKNEIKIRVQELRKARNITQVQLAKTLCVSKQSVSNWENNNILPSIEMLVRIAKYFSVSTDYLLYLDDRKYVETTNLDEKQIAHFQQLMDDVAKNNI